MKTPPLHQPARELGNSRSLRVISLFAGIGGFDLGFAQAGFEIVAHVEKDENCRALLKAKWPDALALDDVTTAGAHNLPACDVLVGGWPCQGLSVAGLRKGLADARSGLFFEFTRIAHEIQPAVIVWENVPGLFTSCSCRACGRCCKGCGEAAGADDEECAACGGAEFRGRVLPQHRGADFFAVVSTFGGLGFDGGWRVFDAQHFGLAQRRRRVFGVFARRNPGASGVSEVLSLAEGVRGHPAPGRGAGQRVAGDAGGGVAKCLGASDGGVDREDRHTLIVEGQGDKGKGRQGEGETPLFVGLPEVACAIQERDSKGADSNTKPGHLIAVNTGQVAVAFKASHYTRDKDGAPSQITPPMSADADKGDQDTLILAFPQNLSGTQSAATEDLAPVLQAENPTAVAFQARIGRNGRGQPEEICPTLNGADAGATSDMRPLVALSFKPRHYRQERKDGAASDVTGPLTANAEHAGDCSPHVATFNVQSQNSCAMRGSGPAMAANPADVARCLDLRAGFTAQQGGTLVAAACDLPPITDHSSPSSSYTVRRLTPRECERLQGFQWRCAPDLPGAWQDELARWWSPDWTAGFSDSVRYRMLGNAVAVPCARWLAERVRRVLERGTQP